MSRRIMYLLSENGLPDGCIAIETNRSIETVTYQVSVLNPRDRFNRAVARQLAIGRLIEEPLKTSVSKDATMHDITETVMRDMLKYKDVPARAIKAAKIWIRQNGISTIN